jgi:polyisoprenoid-binding protein YceI
MVVRGTSNLHDWESRANEVRANGEIVTEGSLIKSVASLQLEIPVRGIKSPKGSIMDGKTYDALKATAFPYITYKLDKVLMLTPKSGGYEGLASGVLTIAGVSRPTELTVTGKMGADGSVVFSGRKQLKMTDFKISPPTALMGTLTTGDGIEVVYTITLKAF